MATSNLNVLTARDLNEVHAAVEIMPMRGDLRLAEPMARHTSWRAGGPADRYYEPADLNDLAAFLAQLPNDEPLTWIGLGSNLLVRDGGIRGTVISLARMPGSLEPAGENGLVAGAGVACAKVARFSAELGLAGAEFLAGIPGTLGGALAMNAGAFGSETWDVVDWVETVDRSGQRQRRRADEFTVGYRKVQAPHETWFVTAGLKLQPGDAQVARRRIRDLLAQRAEQQPMGQSSCGSVFRNPPGDFAGRLIEACGLKGFCIGRACVSDKHANFIINTGGATAADIEALITHVQVAVSVQTGIELVPEVRIIGELLAERNEDDRL
jgi:UDP-N-acetylmuramate dehydrogenase